MYYIIVEIHHETGLSNKIPIIKKCFITRADVFEDGSVYIELLIEFDKENYDNINVLYDYMQNENNIVVSGNMLFPDVAKFRYIMPPEKNSVIREIKKIS